MTRLSDNYPPGGLKDPPEPDRCGCPHCGSLYLYEEPEVGIPLHCDECHATTSYYPSDDGWADEELATGWRFSPYDIPSKYKLTSEDRYRVKTLRKWFAEELNANLVREREEQAAKIIQEEKERVEREIAAAIAAAIKARRDAIDKVYIDESIF